MGILVGTYNGYSWQPQLRGELLNLRTKGHKTNSLTVGAKKSHCSSPDLGVSLTTGSTFCF